LRGFDHANFQEVNMSVQPSLYVVNRGNEPVSASSQVESQLSLLEREASALASLVAELEKRLFKVLRPERPHEQVHQDLDTEVPLAAAIRGAHLSIGESNRQLNELLARLEL
jgi:hypothetical protein